MNTIKDIDNIQSAWLWASKLHHGQKYGGAKVGEEVDYINHIGSVVLEITNTLPYEKTINVDCTNVVASKILISRDNHEFLYSLLK